MGRPYPYSSIFIDHGSSHKDVKFSFYWVLYGQNEFILNSTTTNVCPLFSVNDTIIFCDNDCEQMLKLPCILVWFEVISDPRVNLAKSCILSVG